MERQDTDSAIKTFRQQKGLTLAELASASGLSESYLSQIERGLAEPSLSALRQLAAGLEVPVVTLIDEGTPSVSVTRADQRPKLGPGGSEVSFQLLTPDLNRRIEFLYIDIPPGKSNFQEPVQHPGEECHLVLSGTVLLELGNDKHLLNKGDSVYFLSTREHRIINVGDDHAVLVTAVSPPTSKVQLLLAARANTINP